MQTMFSYGSRKTAVTPRTILFGLLPQMPNIPMYYDPGSGKMIVGTPEATARKNAQKQQEELDRQYALARAAAQRLEYDAQVAKIKEKAKADLDYENATGKKPSNVPPMATSLLLPLGAGLAAWFFLKGH